MAKVKKTPQERSDKGPLRPALTPEGREQQCIALAYDLVEERLRNGTATSQETCHFLKLASAKYREEVEIMRLNKDLVVAKTDAYQGSKRIEELFSEAMVAFKRYAGEEEEDEEILDDTPPYFEY